MTTPTDPREPRPGFFDTMRDRWPKIGIAVALVAAALAVTCGYRVRNVDGSSAARDGWIMAAVIVAIVIALVVIGRPRKPRP